MTPDQELKKAILGKDAEPVGAKAGRARSAKSARGKARAARSGGLSFMQRLALKVVVLGLSLAASRMLFFSEDGRAMVEGFQTAVLEVIQGEMEARRADEAALAAAAAAARAEANAASAALSQAEGRRVAPEDVTLTYAPSVPNHSGVVSGRAAARGPSGSEANTTPVPQAITFVPARGGEGAARPSVSTMPGSQARVLRVGPADATADALGGADSDG